MKEIKDYQHLYLGCECIIGDVKWKRPEISPEDIAPFVDLDYGRPIKTKLDFHIMQNFSHKTTLILHPLSDMSEEEAKEIGVWHDWARKTTSAIVWSPKMVKRALSKHFDLFGLIEAGLALDAKTIKK